MSFNSDFETVQSCYAVRAFLGDHQTMPRTKENFKEIFKYLIYVKDDNRIEMLQKLLEYAKNEMSQILNFPGFLEEPWFKSSDETQYSALEIIAFNKDQEVMKFLTERIKEAKTQNTSLSFIISLLNILEQQSVDISILLSLISCHQVQELNKHYSYKHPSLHNLYPNNLLMRAIALGHNVEIIKLLLASGLDPLGCSKPSEKNEATTVIKVILEKKDTTYSKEDKKQIIDALKEAAQTQGKENPLLFSDNALTPLMYVANIKSPEALKLLLEYPEVVDSINSKTPYRKECALKHAVLLNNDATPEKEDQGKEIIKLLLDHDASADIQDEDGANPLMTAAVSGPTLSLFECLFNHLEKKLPREAFIKLLNQGDNNGLTILNYLLMHKNKDQIKPMLEKIVAYGGKDLTVFSSLNRSGKTILDFAKENGHTGELLRFIEEYTPPNEKQLKLIKLKSASHILGLEDDPYGDTMALELGPQDKVNVTGEGFQDKFTLPLMIETLTHYIERTPDAAVEFQPIKEAFEATYKDVDGNLLFERYKNNQMVVIPSGWNEHSITLALYQNKLIISNRGDEKYPDAGVTIFPLKQETIDTLTQCDQNTFSQWIKNLSGTSRSFYIIEKQLNTFIAPNTSGTVAFADLTEENDIALEEELFKKNTHAVRTPKKHPLLVQEWKEYRIGIGPNLPPVDARKRNSCFLTPDALYQIDAHSVAKKIDIRDFDAFTEKLKTLSIQKPLPESYLRTEVSLANNKFHIFKKLIEEEGGCLEDSVSQPARSKEINYYYQEGCTGRTRTKSYGQNSTAKAMIEGHTIPDQEKNNFQNRLLEMHKVPLVTFPSKPQKHGTCSFVNKKSLIEAMLYLSQNPNTEHAEDAKVDAHKNYKKFTEKMRDQYIEGLLNELENPKERVINLQILKKVLNTPEPMSQTQRKRQFLIVDRILDLEKNTSANEYDTFIESSIRNLFRENYSGRHAIKPLLRYLKENKLLKQENFVNLLSLKDVVDDCVKLLAFKDKFSNPKHGNKYLESVDSFVKKSITTLINPDRDEDTLHESLRKNAKESFQHRHFGRRLLLDALAIIGSLGCVIIYNRCKHNRTLFFSHAKTQRYNEIETLFPTVKK